jgi:asparagine synthase (glutamine-hydrolysing)
LIRWNNTAYIHNFLLKEYKSTMSGTTDFDALDRYCDSSINNWHPLCRAQYVEIMLFLSGYLLSSQGDRMLMGHSVEGRFPFLDHRFFEFASNVPPEYKMLGLTEKFLLKKTYQDMIPSHIINRAKQPYRAPIEKCFTKDNLAAPLLETDSIKAFGYFDDSAVGKLRKKLHNESLTLSERENMALVAVSSTQLLHHYFINKNWNKTTEHLANESDAELFLTNGGC